MLSTIKVIVEFSSNQDAVRGIHNPYSTTIYKETGNRRWTAVAALLPLAMGSAVTFLAAQVWHLLAGMGGCVHFWGALA